MRIISVYLFFISFIISINLFANIKSKVPSEISASFTAALQKANSDKQVKLELSTDASNIKLSKLSNDIASKNQSNSHFKTEQITFDVKVKNVIVGYIKFIVGMGYYNKRILGEPSSINKIVLPDDYFAYLNYIKIQDSYQGKGFGSEALLRFNQFLDDMGISYTVLYVESDAKYAANTYKKKGFNFITDTSDIIYKQMGEEEYLKDSSVKLLDETGNVIDPMMIRWRQGDETRALRLRKYVMNLSSTDFEKQFEEYLNYLKSQSWENGNTALHLAVELQNSKLVEMLLNAMSQEAINQQDSDGCTALHSAVDLGNLQIVRMLLSAMSTEGVQAKNKSKKTALDWALRERNKEIISLIRQKLGMDSL